MVTKDWSPDTDKVTTHIQQDNIYTKNPPGKTRKTLVGIRQGQRQENSLQHNLHHKQKTQKYQRLLHWTDFIN